MHPGPAEAGGAVPQPALGEAPGHLQLHQVELPLQRLVLPLALGHLQAHHRVVVVHQLTDLRHRRVGQHLHDGGQLGLEGEAAGHGAPPRGASRGAGILWGRVASGRRATRVAPQYEMRCTRGCYRTVLDGIC